MRFILLSYMGGGRSNMDTHTSWAQPGWIIEAETTEGQGGALRTLVKLLKDNILFPYLDQVRQWKM